MTSGIVDLDPSPPGGRAQPRGYTMFQPLLPAYEAIGDLWYTTKSGNQAMIRNLGQVMPAKTVMPFTDVNCSEARTQQKTAEAWQNLQFVNHMQAWHMADALIRSDPMSLFLHVDESKIGDPKFMFMSNLVTIPVSRLIAMMELILQDLPIFEADSINKQGHACVFTSIDKGESYQQGNLYNTDVELKSNIGGQMLLTLGQPLPSIMKGDTPADPLPIEQMLSNKYTMAVQTPSMSIPADKLAGFQNPVPSADRPYIVSTPAGPTTMSAGLISEYFPLTIVADKKPYTINGSGIDPVSLAVSRIYAIVGVAARNLVIALLSCDKIFLPDRSGEKKVSLKDLWLNPRNVEGNSLTWKYAWDILYGLACNERDAKLEPAYTQFFYGMRWLKTLQSQLMKGQPTATWFNPLIQLINEPETLLPIYGLANILLRFSDTWDYEKTDVIDELSAQLNKLSGVITKCKELLQKSKPTFSIRTNAGDDLISSFQTHGLNASRILSVEGIPVVGQLPAYGNRMLFLEGIETHNWFVPWVGKAPVKLRIEPTRQLLWQTFDEHRVLYLKNHVNVRYGVTASDIASITDERDTFLVTGPFAGKVAVPWSMFRDYPQVVSRIFPLSVGSVNL